MVDEQLKREVDAYVDEVWEDVVADMDRLVRHDSVEDLSAAEPGKPWGPAANDALVEAEPGTDPDDQKPGDAQGRHADRPRRG